MAEEKRLAQRAMRLLASCYDCLSDDMAAAVAAGFLEECAFGFHGVLVNLNRLRPERMDASSEASSVSGALPGKNSAVPHVDIPGRELWWGPGFAGPPQGRQKHSLVHESERPVPIRGEAREGACAQPGSGGVMCVANVCSSLVWCLCVRVFEHERFGLCLDFFLEGVFDVYM